MRGCPRHLPEDLELPAPLRARSQGCSCPCWAGKDGEHADIPSSLLQSVLVLVGVPLGTRGLNPEPQIPPTATCPQPCHLAAPHPPLAAGDKTCWPLGEWKSTRSGGWAAPPARHRIPTAYFFTPGCQESC